MNDPEERANQEAPRLRAIPYLLEKWDDHLYDMFVSPDWKRNQLRFWTPYLMWFAGTILFFTGLYVYFRYHP
jgi:hypothetical protein